MKGPCFLCLSTFSRGGKERELCTLLSLIQCQNSSNLENSHDLISQVKSKFVSCSKCESFISSAFKIDAQIGQLNASLKKEIENIRKTILDSGKTEGKIDGFKSKDLLNIRSTFVELIGQKGSADPKDNLEPNFDQLQVKIEFQEDSNSNPEFDEGPSSPSAFMLHPEETQNQEEEMEFEFEDAEPFKQEFAEESTSNLNQKSDGKTKIKKKKPTKEATKTAKIKQIKGKMVPKANSRLRKRKEESLDVNCPKSQEYKDEEVDSPKVENVRKKSLKRQRNSKTPKIGKSGLPFTCPICPVRAFHANWKLINHLFAKHETEDKPLSCEKCGKKFSQQVNLQRHLDLHQFESDQPFICDFCDTRFISESKLERHKTSHEKKIGEFPCQHCDRILKSSEHLTYHLRTHTGEKPYKCDHCPQSFINFSRRKAHVEKVHNSHTKFPCNICETVLSTSANLQIHLNRHAGKGCFSLKCPEEGCDAVFKQQETLRSHQILVHGKDGFVCDECGTTLSSVKGLRDHKKSHTGIKQYKCNICSAEMKTQTGLKIHLATHSNERPFLCSFCGRGYKTKAQMRGHEKMTHSTDPARLKVPCPHCNKRFEYKSILEKHLRMSHTGERPYSCDLCKGAFALKSQLTIHQRNRHGNNSSRGKRSNDQYESSNDNNFDNNQDLSNEASLNDRAQITNSSLYLGAAATQNSSNFLTAFSNSLYQNFI